jgi:REP element-mobilizing transposase RayT
MIGARRRNSLRLRSDAIGHIGARFITVTTKPRLNLLAEITAGNVNLTDFGRIVKLCWDDLPRHFPEMDPDEMIVMPDHLHALIWIDPSKVPEGRDVRGVGEVVKAWKSFSARRINEMRGTPGAPLWHRDYYDRIIRNEEQLDACRAYIRDNPSRWESQHLQSDASAVVRANLRSAPSMRTGNGNAAQAARSATHRIGNMNRSATTEDAT